jgi:hypothetical protein
LLADDATYQLNSHGVLDARDDYLCLQTTTLSAVEVAERIIEHFGMPRVPVTPFAT